MRTFNSITLILIFIFFGSCSSDKAPTTSAENFVLKWELLENQLQEKQHKALFTLVNNGPALTGTDWAIYYNQSAGTSFTIPAGSPVTIEFIMGTLYRLIPTKAFTSLPQGDTLSLEYVANGFIAKNSQQPLTPYFVAPGGKATTIAQYDPADLTIDSPEIQKIAQLTLPIPSNLFEKNKGLTKLPLSQLTRVVPTPLSVKPGKGTFTLQTPLVIYFEKGLANEASLLREALAQVLAGEIKVEEGKGQSLQLKLKSDGNPESYTLSINTTGIQVTGADAAGVFYGIQSLRALLPVASFASPSSTLAIDQLTIEDEPRYPYRGMFLDVARNFESKETVKKLLNLMAFYKLNYFHIHISEDEAWRLEIPGLPELTTIGARRGHTTTEEEFLHPEYGSGPDPSAQTSPGNGFYSRADFIEILKHAKSRNIKVITEVDIPGHSRAAIVAMKARYSRLMKEGKTEEANQYALHDPEDQSKYLSIQNFPDNVMCVCRPSSLTFMEKVFDEIILMYKDADAPLESIHIGGDEVPKGVWEGSPICKEFMKTRPDLKKSHDLMPYFIGELVKILNSKGLITSGWQEIAMREAEGGNAEVNPEFTKSGMRPYVWVPEPDLPYRLANAGYTPIIANASRLYFDLAANNDPEVPGQVWAGHVDTRSAWELVPNNVFYSSEVDARGNTVNPDELMKKSVMLTPEGEKNILGLQGQLWTEVAKTPELLDYFVYPKLLGLAERAWAANPEWATISNTDGRKREREKAWNLFVNTVGQREMPRLSYLEGGVKYRIPRPGAVIENGQLMANVEYPGLIIRYTTDGSEPTAASTEYTEPIAVDRTVKLKCFDASGRSGLTAVVPVD